MLRVNITAEIAVADDSIHKREGADSLLAKNLLVARAVAGLTQQELASASEVSRATIAQLETGYSDPRLSTVTELARALGIPTIFLLLGIEELQALASLLASAGSTAEPSVGRNVGSSARMILRNVSSADLALMQDYIRSGMLKDRVRAARVGAAIARASGAEARSASVMAGIFSAILPGIGTSVGIALAELLARQK